MREQQLREIVEKIREKNRSMKSFINNYTWKLEQQRRRHARKRKLKQQLTNVQNVL